MKTISPAEKNDVLIALTMAYEKNFAQKENREPAETARDVIEKRLRTLNGEDFEALKSRVEIFDDLTGEQRDAWLETRLDKIRRRGFPTRLDPNINPSNIVEALSREPKAVQTLILRNLSDDLSRRIALYLGLDFVPEDKSVKKTNKVNQEIVELIKQKFLSNFVALEDIYEPDELDKFTFDRLEDFIRHLGLREIAIACRGINSKENLAAFLNRFNEDEVREIAIYITELEKIRPFWVAQADALVRKSWSADLPSAKVIKKVGFALLAATFALRDVTKCEYAAQKLSVRDLKNWQRLVRINKKKYETQTEDERQRLDKRRRIVEKLAVKFVQTGKL